MVADTETAMEAAESTQEVLVDYTEELKQLHEDLLSVQNALIDLQPSSTQVDLTGVEEKLISIQDLMPIQDERNQVVQSLEEIQKQLVIMQEYQEGLQEDETEDKEKVKDVVSDEEESADPAQDLEEDGLSGDQTDVLPEIADSLQSINDHLETMEIYMQNNQNLQVSILCSAALCFGGILAVILSMYLRH